MTRLQISRQQAGDLSDDLVRRHALTLARQTDLRQNASAPMPAGAPPAAARLAALHAVMRADLASKAGPAAEYLAVDLFQCAGRLAQALQAGAAYRETAAAALMSAAAALGVRWLGDERLCINRVEEGGEVGEGVGGAVSVPALPEALKPEELRAWAETVGSKTLAGVIVQVVLPGHAGPFEGR